MFDHRPTSYQTQVSPVLLFFACLTPLVIFLVWHYRLPLGFVDDAYIPMIYARNIARGYGCVFYPGGEVVEGFSNPLWTLTLTIAHVIGMPMTFTAYWMGMLGAAGSIFLVIAIYRQAFTVFEPPTFWNQYLFPSLAACLTVLDFAFIAWSSSGMETSAYTFLILLLCYLIQSSKNTRAQSIVLILIALIRPEGILYIVPAFVLMAMQARKFSTVVHDLFWCVVTPFAVFVVLRYLYFGYPLPNTYYAKYNHGAWEMAKRGFDYLLTFFKPRILMLFPLFWFLYENARERMRALPVVLFILWHLLITAVEGGDHFAMHRFLVPVVPLLSILTVRGMRCIALKLVLRKTLKKSGFSVFVTQTAVAIVFALIFAGHSQQLYEFKEENPYYSAKDAKFFLSEVRWARSWREIGEWLKTKYPPGTTIAVITAGAIPYYSELHCIDLLGLNDTAIAHHNNPGDTARFTGHEKSHPEYVLQRKPIMMQLFPLLFFSSQPYLRDPLPGLITYPAQRDLWDMPQFHEQYEFMEEETQYGIINYFERKDYEP